MRTLDTIINEVAKNSMRPKKPLFLRDILEELISGELGAQ